MFTIDCHPNPVIYSTAGGADTVILDHPLLQTLHQIQTYKYFYTKKFELNLIFGADPPHPLLDFSSNWAHFFGLINLALDCPTCDSTLCMLC